MLENCLLKFDDCGGAKKCSCINTNSRNQRRINVELCYSNSANISMENSDEISISQSIIDENKNSNQST